VLLEIENEYLPVAVAIEGLLGCWLQGYYTTVSLSLHATSSAAATFFIRLRVMAMTLLPHFGQQSRLAAYVLLHR